MVAVAAYLVITAVLVRHDLNRVRDEVGRLRAAIVNGDNAGVKQHLAAVQSASNSAHEWTTGPVWFTASAIPWLGDPVDTARSLTATAHGLANGVLPRVVDAAVALSPDKIRVSSNQIDLDRVRLAVPALAEAQAATTAAQREVQRLPGDTWLSPVNQGRAELLSLLDDYLGTLADANDAAHLLPAMLGADGPRNYLLVFQNEAESRGLGGLPGAFAVLHADHGRIEFRHFGNDSVFPNMNVSLDRFGADFVDRYKQFGVWQLFQNSDMSPHFPYDAQLWMQMWHQTFGQRLDGAIATDPTALSYLLKVTGPTTLPDGTQISADNVVALTQNEVYGKIPDPDAQNKFFIDVATSVAHHLLSSSASAHDLLSALGRAVDERRFMLWSAHPTEETTIQKLPLAGLLPQTRAPFTMLDVNNGAGSKLDYYLARSLTYQPGKCTAHRRSTTVTATLKNAAPPHGLPSYVTFRADHPLRAFPSSNVLLVSIYATQGSQLRGMEVDGKRAAAIIERERGHEVYTVDLTLKSEQTRTITLHLSEPRTAGPVQTLTQPLVWPQTDRIEQPTC